MKYNKLIKELNDIVKFSLEEEEILYENELKDKVHKFIENPKEENLDYLEQQVLGNTYFYRAYYDFYYNSNEKNFQKIIDGLYYYVTS
ncbi:MAG: hypothetical protein LBI57_06455, partial [Helicobacteraceae bacterium]|nr:hypothetical protein [Helicobacteraceae bacterium]